MATDQNPPLPLIVSPVAAGGTALALGASPLARIGVALAQAQPFATDRDVLNYALTLEHLEATLYNTIVGSGVIKNPTFVKYVTIFQAHDNDHARALTKAIADAGGKPVEAKAKYNFAAFDVSTEQKAMPVIAAVEEVGVGAYQGAADFIKDKEILTTAVAIQGVEAEHTGSMHHLLGLKPTGDSLAAAAGFSTNVLAGAVTATVAKLGRTPVKPRTPYNFLAFDTQENILAFLSKIKHRRRGQPRPGRLDQERRVLGAAAGTYALEALRTAAMRTLLGRDANPNGAYEKGLTGQQVLAAAGPLLGPEAGGAMPTTLPRTGGLPALPALRAIAVGAGLAALGTAALAHPRRAPGRDDEPAA